ncbi:hypothetical protein G6M12_07095 [Agrobacterium tumefaciens]|jgi:hypothetical protein|nr:hypothetical protein [Agrobacterium tumefaciens]
MSADKEQLYKNYCDAIDVVVEALNRQKAEALKGPKGHNEAAKRDVERAYEAYEEHFKRLDEAE